MVDETLQESSKCGPCKDCLTRTSTYEYSVFILVEHSKSTKKNRKKTARNPSTASVWQRDTASQNNRPAALCGAIFALHAPAFATWWYKLVRWYLNLRTLLPLQSVTFKSSSSHHQQLGSSHGSRPCQVRSHVSGACFEWSQDCGSQWLAVSWPHWFQCPKRLLLFHFRSCRYPWLV